jgi:DNA-binding transcriptional LysR family regulator
MEIKYLKTFIEIVNAGSFQKASERLGYAQSTVTFQIQQLEKKLSLQLFEKIGRKMALSQAGKDVLPYVKCILDTVEQLENYGKKNKELRGTLKIAIPETLLTYQIQSVLKKFREKAPNVKLSVTMLNCYDIRDKVLNGEYDLGYHYDLGDYSSSIVVEKLAEYSLVLIAPTNLSNDESDFMAKNKHKKVAMLVGDNDSVFQSMFDTYLKVNNIELSTRLNINSIEAIKRSVASGIGIAFLPKYVVQDYIEQGLVKEIKTGLSSKTVTSVCIYHKNRWITPAMELFLHISKNLKKKD